MEVEIRYEGSSFLEMRRRSIDQTALPGVAKRTVKGAEHSNTKNKFGGDDEVGM